MSIMTKLINRQLIIISLIAPLLSAIILPVVIRRGMLRFDNNKPWASVATKDDVIVSKVFPEEINLQLWDQDELFKIKGDFYRVSIKHTFIAKQLFKLYLISLLILLLGGGISYHLLRQLIKSLPFKEPITEAKQDEE